ncbi:hypothetical protein [Pleionea sediminis]|uniref:hypothetical protein n=1 Tax=Pleionea sediminis TaxID=2569479 RepID=UPI00118638D4|nr:hypothetical protein [Pleionea sediminis]
MMAINILPYPMKALALVVGLSLCCTSVDAKKFYRFKNSEGQTILLDQLSPEAIEKGYEIINERGQLVQRVGPAKTLGEMEEEKEKEKELKRKERERQRQIRRDAELLRLFSTVEDIMRARDAALLGVQQRSELNKNEKELIKASLEDSQRRAADYERLGKKVPKNLTENIATLQKQIANRETNEKAIEEEGNRIKEEFERDIIRFKELQAKRMAHRFKNDSDSEQKNNVLMMTCDTSQSCKNIWQLAQVYAQSNSSGRLEVVTDTIILTSAPKQDSDVGISFSRLPSKTNTQIIIEVSCTDTDAGQQLCSGPEAQKLVNGFKEFVDKQIR